jgi:hypothetical protein
VRKMEDVRKKWAIQLAVQRYARGIAKTMGVPVEQVINSAPVQHYREALQKRQW